MIYYRHPLLRLLRENAAAIGARLAKAAARDLKNYRDNLPSGPDSGLKNVWEEICVQVQGEQSFFWDGYRDMAIGHLAGRVRALPAIKQRLLWVGSPGGMDWIDEHDESEDNTVPGTTVPTGDADEIANWLFDEHLIPLADRYGNRRIERYLEGNSEIE